MAPAAGYSVAPGAVTTTRVSPWAHVRAPSLLVRHGLLPERAELDPVDVEQVGAELEPQPGTHRHAGPRAHDDLFVQPAAV